MAKMILAAGIVRDIWFDTLDDLERYIEKLEYNSIEYYEIERCERPGGHFILRIVTQYNNSDLIEL